MTRWIRGGFAVGALAALVFVTAPQVGAEDRGSPDGLWAPRSALSIPSGSRAAWIRPTRFAASTLATDVLEGLLDAALPEPLGGDLSQAAGGVRVYLPRPDGTFQPFRVWESPVFAPELAEAFPEIRSFVGLGESDPRATLRCDWTPLGFHAQVLSPGGDWLVDPIWRDDVTLYAAYWRSDSTPREGGFVCGVEDFVDGRHLRLPSAAALTSGANLRTYRLAVAATGEYTANFGGTVALGLAAINTMVGRVTGIFERDLAVRLQVIAGNSAIVYTDGTTDPFTTDGTGALTNPNAEAQAAIDAAIGDANYDIGHLVHDGPGGGNAGGVGTVCQTGIKGAAFTAISPPEGDAFFIDFVAHEMGHQFGGSHTWNGSNNGCVAGQYSGATAWEPGSGSTIMSYMGLCGADDLPGQPQADPDAITPRGVSDAYFHTGNIAEIVAYTTSGAGNCPAPAATGNTPPTVNGGSDFTIPASTPFVLTASGSDADGDPLTFCWEEMDAGGTQAPLSTADDGVIPLFRSFIPTTDTSRTFPRLSDLLAGNLFPGTLGEQLPTVNRTLDFRVTARDNQPNGGGVTTDDVALTVNAAAGPFQVTSPNGGETWTSATVQTVTWDVAGTDLPPISTSQVNILLSTDGGLTYAFTLAAATANDGTENVSVPSCQLFTTCRVKVEAVGNVYFDVSDADFSIVDVTPPTVTCNVGRRVLWPAARGLLDVGLTSFATDDCDVAPTLSSVVVHSDEPNGVAPYAPDATFVGGVLKLRAERAFPGTGRIYLIVVNYVDATGNTGFDVCTVTVPLNTTVSHLTALAAEAATQRAACIAAAGAPPAGYVTVMP